MYFLFLYVDKLYMYVCVIYKIFLLYLRDMKLNIIVRFLVLWDVFRFGFCCVLLVIFDYCFCFIF